MGAGEMRFFSGFTLGVFCVIRPLEDEGDTVQHIAYTVMTFCTLLLAVLIKEQNDPTTMANVESARVQWSPKMLTIATLLLHRKSRRQ